MAFFNQDDDAPPGPGITQGTGLGADVDNERGMSRVHIPFKPKKNFFTFRKFVAASLLAVLGWCAPGIYDKFFGEHRGDAEPKIPPHYAYTLKAGPAVFENAHCPTAPGKKELKLFDSMYHAGISDSKSTIADSVVRAVLNNKIVLCSDDLPGDQGAMKIKGGMVVIDSTVRGEPEAATQIYMVLYELNARRGALTYSSQWSLLERQTHLMSFEATALVTQLGAAYQRKASGDPSMWLEMAQDRFTGPLAATFEKNVAHAMKRLNYAVPVNVVMEETSRMTFAQVFNDPGFAGRYNNWLLNTYVREMYDGKLKGPGVSTQREFATTMGRIDQTFNATAGATSAPMFNCFGGDYSMREAFSAVEMFRREMLAPQSVGDKNVIKADRAHNAYGQLSMKDAIKSWQENGFAGNFKDHLDGLAGVKRQAAPDAARPTSPPPQVVS